MLFQEWNWDDAKAVWQKEAADEVDAKWQPIVAKNIAQIARNEAQLADKDAILADKDAKLADKDAIIEQLKAQLGIIK